MNGMNVIVVGCGRIGSELAYSLFKRGHRVTVMDRTDDAFEILPPDFAGRMIHGEVLERETLRRANIRAADGLAAVTSSDSLNAVIGHLARETYGIANVVVRNYELKWLPIEEALGLQVISPAKWGAQRIAELLSERSLHTVFSAGNGEVEVYEFLVPNQWAKRTCAELLPAGCLPVALTRAGVSMLPSTDQPLQAGDVLHVSASEQGAGTLLKRLGPKVEDES